MRYVPAGDNGLRVIDVSNPAAPIEVGHYVTTTWSASYVLWKVNMPMWLHYQVACAWLMFPRRSRQWK